MTKTVSVVAALVAFVFCVADLVVGVVVVVFAVVVQPIVRT